MKKDFPTLLGELVAAITNNGGHVAVDVRVELVGPMSVNVEAAEAQHEGFTIEDDAWPDEAEEGCGPGCTCVGAGGPELTIYDVVGWQDDGWSTPFYLDDEVPSLIPEDAIVRFSRLDRQGQPWGDVKGFAHTQYGAQVKRPLTHRAHF